MDSDELLPSNNYSTPRRSTKPSNNSANNEILKTYQVNAFKYVNKKYDSLGKVGLALVGSKISNNFNILVYGKNNIHITQANIKYEFDITSPEELYVSFYDMKSENWSLRFDSIEFFNDFLSRICIYKMMSSNKSEMVIIDLKTGNGAKVQELDFCEIELTINSVKNCEVSSIIYSSDNQDVLRTQIGSNKLLQAVEKGLIGMLKGGFRVIGVPFKSPLLKGGAISIPNDTNIIAFIKLIRTKSKIEKPPKPNIIEDEIPLPDLDKSDPEVEGTEKTKKTELLQRLARMGIPMIPTHTPESSSSDVPMISGNYLQPSHPNFLPTQNSTYSVYDTNMISKQLLPLHSVNLVNQTNPINIPNSTVNPVFSQIQNVPISNDFSVLFTETRQNNTEMRVGMSKLQDKVDKILERLDMRLDNTHQSQVATRHMDAENVFENIRRIINDNESLKVECSQKSDMIEKQNRRINEMLKNSQLYLEESHDVIQQSAKSFNISVTEHEVKILKLEEEKLNLLRNLHQKTSEVSSLEQKLEQSSNESQSYRTKSLEFNEQLDKLTEEAGELKLRNRSLQTELNELKLIQHTDSVSQADFETRTKQWVEEEAVLKKKLELAKVQVQEVNGKIRKVQSECDAEITEVRQQCHQEIEEWQTKLKSERDRMKKKTDELSREIDLNNQSWEQRFDEYREKESEKSGKLSERNSQLMIENAGLRRQVTDLQNRISVSGDIQSEEVDELRSKILVLSDQLTEANRKHSDSGDLKRKNYELQSEIDRLKLIIDEFETRRPRYELLVNENAELTEELTKLKKLYSKLIETQTETIPSTESRSVVVEDKVKKIMNDVFKQIKADIDGDEQYSGDEVINKCLVIIRDITMENIKNVSTVEDEYGDSDEDQHEGNMSEDESSDIEHQSLSKDEIADRFTSAVEEIEENSSEGFSQPNKEIDDRAESSPIQLTVITPPEMSLSVGRVQSFQGFLDNQLESGINLPEFTTESKEVGIDIESAKVDVSNDNIESSLDKENKDLKMDPHSVDKEENFYSFMKLDDINGHQSIGIGENLSILKVVSADSNKIAHDEIEACEVVESTDFVPVESLDIEISEKTAPIKDEVTDIASEKDETFRPISSDEKRPPSPLSSDEDAEVLDFFEKLSQKTKPQESQKPEKPKPSFVSDIDDDLSWLNN